jgi:NADH-quinone oxidoreductase subunit I
MLGFGVVKGLAVTFKHFVETYIDDIKYFPRRYSEEALESRQSVSGRGIFTVQYPEQELTHAETFRYIPFLVYDEDRESVYEGIRCTSCGICANCGYCAEYCPFDAIIMDHDWKLADYDRFDGHIHDLERLLKPASYYEQLRPIQYAENNPEEAEEDEENEH